MRQLLHISDIHFGPYHRPEVAAGVVDLTHRLKPDLVAISGDLTQRAKVSQFRQARAWVDALEQETGVPTLSVPGNHDVPLYRFWERAASPFGPYRKHFAEELEPEHEDEEMLVLGVNTAYNWTLKDGYLPLSRIERIGRRLATADGKIRIVMLHHALVPAPRFDNRRVARHAVEAVDLMTDQRVDLVLAGHMHQSYFVNSEAYYPSGRAGVVLAHTGTTSSSRGRGCELGECTANWVRIDEHEVDIANLGWHDEEKRFAVWSRHRFPRPHRGVDGLGAP